MRKTQRREITTPRPHPEARTDPRPIAARAPPQLAEVASQSSRVALRLRLITRHSHWGIPMTGTVAWKHDGVVWRMIHGDSGSSGCARLTRGEARKSAPSRDGALSVPRTACVASGEADWLLPFQNVDEFL